MRILWNNIIALIVLLAAGVLLAKFAPAMTAVLTNIKNIGPNHTTDEKVVGLIALGFLGVLVVAVVKILTTHNPK